MAAVPAETASERPAQAELIYREEPEGPVPESTARPETQTARRALSAAPQTLPPSAREEKTEPAEAAGQPAPARTALPTAIPAAAAAAKSAELVFREEAGAIPPADALRSGALPPRGSGAAVRSAPGQTPAPGILRHRSGGQTPAPEPTARDIRMTASKETPGRGAATREIRSTARRNGETFPTVPLVPAQTPPPERLSAALPARETGDGSAPPELIFAPQLPAAGPPPEEAGAQAAQRPPRSENAESLPPWARELLEQSGVSDTAIRTAAFGGKNAAQGARQISWTAPGTAGLRQQGAGAGPAELSFRERGGGEETPRQRAVSDAELQRTADKVYRIIEERLRRELRRSGR